MDVIASAYRLDLLSEGQTITEKMKNIRSTLWILSVLVILAFALNGCATAQSSSIGLTDEVRMQARISDLLFRDLLTGIGGVGFADEVNFPSAKERKLIRIEVIVPYDNQQTGVERWTVSHGANEVASYTVKLVPDGQGGTNFAVSKDTVSLGANSAASKDTVTFSSSKGGTGITIGDRHFTLAGKEKDLDGEIRNYLLPGENFENWSRLVAVKQFAKAGDSKQYVSDLAQQYHANFPLMKFAVMQDLSKGDWMIDFLTYSPDGSGKYFEWDFFRASNSKGSLIVYQYAVRYFYKQSVGEVADKVIAVRKEMIGKLWATEFEEKVEPNQEPEPTATDASGQVKH